MASSGELAEITVLLLQPGSHPYQQGAILGRATVPLIIALYMSGKFAKRHSDKSETAGGA